MLPLFPLEFVLDNFARRIAATHPTISDRLGEYGTRRFAIDPADLPVSFILFFKNKIPAISVRRSLEKKDYDAKISGPFVLLTGLLDGKYDGDALFFSREIIIEGDTEAILALRNALDDAEINLLIEFFLSFPTLQKPLEKYGYEKLRSLSSPLTISGWGNSKTGNR